MSKPNPRTNEPTGRFAYDGLDRIIHEKARLSIVASLSTHPQGLPWGDLKELCALTDGNLSRHLQILTEAGLVEVSKGFAGNRPQTHCRLTAEGRRRFLEYVTVLENVVTDALGTAKDEPRARKVLGEGWSPA
jgi:DNA-binding MarR family transcriptional regulator